MNENKECHRELFESLIYPLQININGAPYAGVSNKMFSLQVNGEVLWKLKDISGNPGTAFALIQRSLTKPLGHQLEDASRDRVRHALASAIRNRSNFLAIIIALRWTTLHFHSGSNILGKERKLELFIESNKGMLVDRNAPTDIAY